MNKRFFLISALFLILLSMCEQKVMAQMPQLPKKYQKLELKASPDVKKEILRLRKIGKEKKWTFQIGNTSVSKYLNKNGIKLITGAQLPVRNKNSNADRAKSAGNIRLNLGINAHASRYDIRNRGLVTPVKNQGGCGSCWAFCSTACIETAQIIRNNHINKNNIDLSEQYVLSCSDAGSCAGGRPDRVFEHFKATQRGFPTDGSFSYRASDLSCPATPSYTDYKVETWGWVSRGQRATVQKVKNALATYGAVDTYIWVNSSFGRYTNGVINDDDRTGWGGLHCVQIVGWDDDLHAYLIKNSWGTEWGMNGFAWVNYEVLEIGTNVAWVVAKEEEVTDLNGYYNCDDGGRYYIRQIGNNIYWFGEHPSGNWANVFKGNLNGSSVRGDFYDVPKGRMKGKGRLELKVSNGGRKIEKISGPFGGKVFTKASLPRNLPKFRDAGFSSPSLLDGLWNGNDGAQYYIRQIGNKVVWIGESPIYDKRPHFSNVAFGTKSGNRIRLEWADIPKGTLNANGVLVLKLDQNKKLTKISGSGFGASSWSRALNLNGTWTNIDANTRGVTRFTVSDRATKIRVYGACEPNDCDWGVNTLTKKPQGYFEAVHKKEKLTKRLLIYRESDQKIKMTMISKYKDGRPSKTSVYVFRKQ